MKLVNNLGVFYWIDNLAKVMSPTFHSEDDAWDWMTSEIKPPID